MKAIHRGRLQASTASIGLLAMTALWGGTFVLVKRSVEHFPPFEFLFIRFFVAAVVLAVVFPRKALQALRVSGTASLWTGIPLGIGYAFQTVGLRYTGATQSGFITGLFVVFTPLFAFIFMRRRSSKASLAGVVTATVGLVLLTGARGLSAGSSAALGNALTLGCAIAFAAHIVLLSRYAPEHDPIALTIGQMGVAAIGFGLIASTTEALSIPNAPELWIALAVTSIGASALGFLVLTWAQRVLAPTPASVILTMEPVFAGVAGFLLLNERLDSAGWIGAALILIAVMWVSLSAEA